MNNYPKFNYLDLNDPAVTQGYRPRPASNPGEVYVAILGQKEIDSGEKCPLTGKKYMTSVTVVEAVYRLATKKKSSLMAEFVTRKSDGKTFGFRITRPDLVDMLRQHYDDLYEEKF